MATQENVKLIRDFYDAFERGDFERAASYLAPNAEFKIIGMEKPFRGPNEIVNACKEWNQAFPDMKSQIINVISSNDSVVVEEINRGTHKGPLTGHAGTLAATNRKVEVPACEIFKISNGKVLTWTLYWPSDVMMRQLGYGMEKRAA